MAEGRLQPGEAIDQGAICQELSVSKAPLRDALIRLEAEGFITINPRKGVVVNRISREFIRSAYQIIGAVEADCIDEVFARLGAKHVRMLEDSNQRQRVFLAKKDFYSYYEENIFFHNVFLSLSKNSLLSSVLDPLRNRLYDFPRRAYALEWEEFHLENHQRFIDSVKVGNKAAALNIFRFEHWSYEVHKPFLELYYQFDSESQDGPDKM